MDIVRNLVGLGQKPLEEVYESTLQVRVRINHQLMYRFNWIPEHVGKLCKVAPRHGFHDGFDYVIQADYSATLQLRTSNETHARSAYQKKKSHQMAECMGNIALTQLTNEQIELEKEEAELNNLTAMKPTLDQLVVVRERREAVKRQREELEKSLTNEKQ
eukprot:PhF_6_TR1655/c0_g1_i1/m.2899